MALFDYIGSGITGTVRLYPEGTTSTTVSANSSNADITTTSGNSPSTTTASAYTHTPTGYNTPLCAHSPGCQRCL